MLQKLWWFRRGNEVSDRQWRDVLGVLKVKADLLDYDYLKHWAALLAVSDLLEKAFDDAGIDSSMPEASELDKKGALIRERQIRSLDFEDVPRKRNDQTVRI